MNREVINEILNEYDKKRDRAIYEQKIKQEKVYLKIPEIKQLDNEISKTGFLISRAILENPNCYEEKVKEIRERIEKLKMKKAVLLTENNIPLEYLDIKYECNRCNDTGFLKNGSKCNCLKQTLINKAYKMSNIENVLKKENFQTFNINIFPDDQFEEESMTPRENMKHISDICVDYVNNFNENNEESLLFYATHSIDW